MDNFKAVIFDLGNTLIRSRRCTAFKERLAEFNIEREIWEIKDAFDFSDRYFMKNYPGELAKAPRDFFKKYLNLMLSYLHILSVPKNELYNRIFLKSPPREEWVPYRDTLPVLKELKERKVLIGLFTNWDLGARDLLGFLGLTPFFDSIIVSSEINSEKPAGKGFLAALGEMGVSPREAVFVGDNYYDDIVGANKVGMKALLLNRSKFVEADRPGDYETVKGLSDVLRFFPGEEKCPAK